MRRSCRCCWPRCWRGRPCKDQVEAPVAFAGHSLGQITALIASGALTLEDGVALAVARADCTQAAADATPGRMAALIGADLDVAEKACTDVDAWVANDNAPGQVVIGGTADGLEAATAAGGRPRCAPGRSP